MRGDIGYGLSGCEALSSTSATKKTLLLHSLERNVPSASEAVAGEDPKAPIGHLVGLKDEADISKDRAK